ncbi:MAG: hypothetical protein EXS64_08810 [Candidatus Latescibacteria bacterium]|nr:hypothetical protein [Candidatus Latescibacterota bacterium]
MNQITKLKDLCLTTDLTGAQIVIPASGAYRDAAERIAATARTRWGIALPVVTDDRLLPGGPVGGPAIALGNFSDNRLIEHLYLQFYAFVDRRYPGDGGHVLATVHNPEGDGHNVLLAGGSDAPGVSKAADRLCAAMETAPGPALGRLFEVELGRGMDRERQRLEQALSETPDTWGFGIESEHMVRFGRYYALSGNETFARRFREGMMAMIAAAPENTYEVQVHLSFWGKAMLWDVIEESPTFSDDDRLAITNYLLRVLRSREGFQNPSFRNLARYPEPRQNHQTLLGIALLFGARYFDRYYQLPETREWMALVHEFYRVADDCSKPVCDCAPGWHATLENMATYALTTGRMAFFEKGAARLAADRAILNTNHKGGMAITGDGWAGGQQDAHSLLQKAAWYYRDGRYTYVQDRDPMERALTDGYGFELLRSFDCGLTPVVPVDLAGVAVAPLDRYYYELPYVDPVYASHWYMTVPNVPHDLTFDKISFRTGFDPEDQYLLLDGISGGSHSYEDANGVTEFGQFGRLFIITEDTLHWPNYRDHNVVTIVREGEGALPPTFAGLEGVADFPETGLSRTFLRDYMSADWYRNIVWRKGEYFIFIDELTAKVEGDYTLERRWKVMGAPTLDEGHLMARQDGEGGPYDLHILNADGARLWTEPVPFGLSTDHDPEGLRRHQEWYQTDDLTAHQLHESVSLKMRTGERYVFLNLIHATCPRKPASWSLSRVGQAAARIEGEKGQTLVGAGKFEAPALTIDAQVFTVNGDGFALLNARRLTCGAFAFEADAPISLALAFATGEAQVKALCRASLKITTDADVQEVAVQPGTSALRLNPSTAFGKAVSQALVALPAQDRPARPARSRRRLSSSWTCRTSGAVTSVAPVEEGCVVGSADGAVHRLGANGETLWKFSTGGPVNSVCAADLDGDGRPEILAGSDDCHVYALDAEGRERWRYEPAFGQQYWPWWTLGASRVKKVFADDLDGDGRPEVIAGVANMRLHLLSADGKALWDYRTDHGIFVTLTTADVDLDGRREIVGGMSIKSSTSICLAIGHDGQVRRRYINQGWTSKLTAVRVADLDGDGRPEVICGTNRDFTLRVFSGPEGRLLWERNLGDEVVGIEVLKEKEACRLIVGSPNFYICGFSGEGDKLWAVNLGAAVRVTAALDGRVVAGCEDGSLHLLNGKGRVVGRAEAGSRITALTTLGETILAGCANGNVMAW